MRSIKAGGASSRDAEKTTDRTELKRVIFGKDPVLPPSPVAPLAHEELSANGRAGLSNEPDTFVLYRIIGNDLPPRHKVGQSYSNLEFILNHEEPLLNCEKRWIVNRIADRTEERRVVSLLERCKQPYLVIPFERERYRRVGLDFDAFPEPGIFWQSRYHKLGSGDTRRIMMHAFRQKNIYAINNNGARNLALKDGTGRAKWIMPWDGCCFLTAEAWRKIRLQIREYPGYKYVLVPMSRISDNRVLLSEAPPLTADEEPQIMFRRDAHECFNEEWPYGRRPKVELFWRLGVPWKTEHWINQPWDPEVSALSKEAGQYQFAGWVARLSSGRTEYESSTREAFLRRGVARENAVIAALKRLDTSCSRNVNGPVAIDTNVLDRQAADASCAVLTQRLRAEADLAVKRELYSVTDKGVAVVGTVNDYWFPAPYWWPNTTTLDGRPYVRRPGRRRPGTKLHESGSERYDRARLQRLCDETFVLALAHHLTSYEKYAKHAEELLHCWFINEPTRMTPHLKYAEVRLGHNNDQGHGRGVIQSQSFWYLVDAICLLEKNGGLKQVRGDALRSWFAEYLEWLLRSRQGCWAQARTDFHGVYYELQVAAIALFIGSSEEFLQSMYRAEEKIHFQLNGGPGKESEGRSQAQRGVRLPFSLMGWANLHYLSRGCGRDLWEIDTVRPLVKGAIERFFEDLDVHSRDESWAVARPLATAYETCFGSADFRIGVDPIYVSDSMSVLALQGVRPFSMLGAEYNMSRCADTRVGNGRERLV